MTDGTSPLPASPQRPPGGAEPAIATAARETTSAGKAAMTWQGASNIVVRAALSPSDGHRVLALPYPVEYHAFWRILAGMGVTQERLMDRMGASP